MGEIEIEFAETPSNDELKRLIVDKVREETIISLHDLFIYMKQFSVSHVKFRELVRELISENKLVELQCRMITLREFLDEREKLKKILERKIREYGRKCGKPLTSPVIL